MGGMLRGRRQGEGGCLFPDEVVLGMLRRGVRAAEWLNQGGVGQWAMLHGWRCGSSASSPRHLWIYIATG